MWPRCGGFELNVGDAAPAPIPVPASLPLLTIGLGAMAWTGRRPSR